MPTSESETAAITAPNIIDSPDSQALGLVCDTDACHVHTSELTAPAPTEAHSEN